MRKSSFFFLIVLMAAFAAACSSPAEEPFVDSSPVVEPTQQEAVVEQPTAPPPATLPPPVITTNDENVDAGAADSGQEVASEPEPAPVVVEVEAPPSCENSWTRGEFGYGVQSHATIGDPAYAMEVTRNQLGMNWIKVQVQWFLAEAAPGEYRWEIYDGAVDQAAEKGLCLMLSVVGSPTYTRAAGNHNGPPDDYAAYTEFLTQLLTRYDGKVAAVEVWNEQNLDREWQSANGVSPEDYVQFLAQSNQAIKAVNPNVIVISGALSPTGDGDWVRWADDFAWMDRAIAAGMLDHADCVGAHHNGYNIPPDVAFDQTGALAEAGTATFRGPFDNPHHSWSFRTTLDTYSAKVQAVDPNMQLCVTEFGWASSDGYDTFPVGFEFANDNTVDEQAQYLVQAFNQMRESGDVMLAFVFNFDFGNKGGGPTDDPVPYSIVDTNGAPRPSFSALSAMEKLP